MIKMTGEYVLIEELPVDETTPGGLFIPGGYKDDSIRGTVIDIGPGEKRKNGKLKPTELKKGDYIVFDEKRTYAVNLKGKKYFIMRQTHILGLIENTLQTAKDL